MSACCTQVAVAVNQTVNWNSSLLGETPADATVASSIFQNPGSNAEMMVVETIISDHAVNTGIRRETADSRSLVGSCDTASVIGVAPNLN
jgi:hypothetical protein